MQNLYTKVTYFSMLALYKWNLKLRKKPDFYFISTLKIKYLAINLTKCVQTYMRKTLKLS